MTAASKFKASLIFSLILTLLMASLPQAAAEPWAKAYSNIDPEGTVSVEYIGNDIVLLGNTEQGVVVARIGENGEVVWSKLVESKYSFIGKVLARGPEGSIIAGGTVGDGRGVWIIKLDGNGNVEWTRVYASPGGRDLVDASVADDGSVFGLIELDTPWEYLILKLDPSGNLEWVYRYRGVYDLKLLKVKALENGYILLAGNKGKSLAVAMISAGGVVMWGKVYGIYPGTKLADVARTDDGIILAGSVESDLGVKGLLVKLKPNGAVEFARTYSHEGAKLSIERVILGANDLVLVGTATRIFDSGDVVVLVTDETGEIRTHRIYTAPVGGRVLDASLTGETLTVAMRSYLNMDKPHVTLLTLDIGAMPKECPMCRVSNISGVQASISTSENRFLQLDPPSVPPLIPDSTEVKVSEFSLAVVGSVILESEEASTGKTTSWNMVLLALGLSAVAVFGIFTLGRRKKKSGGKTKSQQKEDGTRNTPRDKSLLFPEELLGKYEPLEFLGEGGFAKVFKVKRREDGKVAALKIPRIDEKTSKGFLKEVSAWLHLNHPNIVRLHDADILPVPYLEMEFVEGIEVNGTRVRDLGAYPKPVGEKRALELIRGIASGLAHAHSKGIYHLDLKPENVLLKGDMTPKITDWGLAKIGASPAVPTTAESLTLLYSAPEQLNPGVHGGTDARTDIYQLGLIFYELLTGKLPYEGSSKTAIVASLLGGSAKTLPPSHFSGALAKYDGIFEKLLAKRKEDRYQSVEEFLHDLELVERLEKEKEAIEREIEKTRTTMMTTSGEELARLKRRLTEQLSRNALLHAQLNDKAGLIGALEELKGLSREYKAEIEGAIEQLELMMREGIPIGKSTIDELRVLLDRVKLEVESETVSGKREPKRRAGITPTITTAGGGGRRQRVDGRIEVPGYGPVEYVVRDEEFEGDPKETLGEMVEYYLKHREEIDEMIKRETGVSDVPRFTRFSIQKKEFRLYAENVHGYRRLGFKITRKRGKLSVIKDRKR
ncbi:Serine/threonine protein kinase, putative S-layer protein [Thermococcus sp. 4557]|uniref:serine/threonine-protein kinase n=1 Tax=Thermococcus sp. (strain CGMCC 1.5172 / 4557) TaxID=1042877 RepID=UPI000219E30C